MELNQLVHGSCLGFQQLHHSNKARIHPQYSDLIILIQVGHEKRGRKKEKLPALTGYSTFQDDHTSESCSSMSHTKRVKE